ncbi:hypothetical protein LTR53_012028 [Teratosphaeriaceae sp. CCFEE 6253]|nr:hypothetical protein LTR53_012028 [Teratosphaeriaceae sp. CCFEE 6253]
MAAQMTTMQQPAHYHGPEATSSTTALPAAEIPESQDSGAATIPKGQTFSFANVDVENSAWYLAHSLSKIEQAAHLLAASHDPAPISAAEEKTAHAAAARLGLEMQLAVHDLRINAFRRSPCSCDTISGEHVRHPADPETRTCRFVPYGASTHHNGIALGYDIATEREAFAAWYKHGLRSMGEKPAPTLPHNPCVRSGPATFLGSSAEFARAAAENERYAAYVAEIRGFKTLTLRTDEIEAEEEWMLEVL